VVKNVEDEGKYHWIVWLILVMQNWLNCKIHSCIFWYKGLCNVSQLLAWQIAWLKITIC